MSELGLVEYAQTTNMFESKPRGYLEIYEKYLAPLRDKEIKLLELGVSGGQSMVMWREYFKRGTIVGVDLFPNWSPDPDEKQIHIYRGAQNDTAFLTKLAEEQAPDGFDIIIDDCAHIGELAKTSFWHLFNHHLKPGGIYAVEDWGSGYLGGYRNVYYPDGEFYDPRERETLLHWIANKVLTSAPVEWRDTGKFQKLFKRFQYTRRFKNHDYGMVGFVKQFVDEVGIADATGPNGSKDLKNPVPQRHSRFAHVLYSPGLVMVTKT
jgi:hypothetical protein